MSDVIIAHCIVIGAELGDHGFEVVFFEPAGQECEVGWEALVADLVLAGEVVVEVLVDIDGGVVDGVDELVEVVGRWSVAASTLVPGMAPGVAISGCEDEVLCARSTNTGDSGLVVLSSARVDLNGGVMTALSKSASCRDTGGVVKNVVIGRG